MSREAIEEARRLVKNAFARTAMGLAYKARNPGEYELVYRVENEYGLSPHDIYGWNDDEKMQSFTNSLTPTRNPLPESDTFDPDEKEALTQFGDFHFGFLNKEQHDRWFTPQQIAEYEAAGFKLKQFKASEIRDSGNQAMFLPLGGSLEDAEN